jgi:arsenical pump membrane protein
MIRPRPFNEATAAALGAVIMLIAGVLSPSQIPAVWQANANILLFFLGLMIISVIADQAGFFEWCAFQAVSRSRGRGAGLLAAIFILGAILTAFFSNDATALILTPIVYVLVSRLKVDPLPYVFACAFIANTASMLLPVSNPVNLLAVGRFDLTLGDYLKHLLLPSLVLILANYWLFRFLFRRSIKPFSLQDQPRSPPPADSYFVAVCGGLVTIALGYILVSVYGLPLSYPALGGAVLLLSISLSLGRFRWRKVVSGLSWQIFVFIFALALLVKGLEDAGVTGAISDGLVSLSSHGQLAALVSVTLGTALGSNLMNNWSMMMISVSSLGSSAGPDLHHILVYGSLIGADIGPNIAILGSLSSMLWLVLLRKRGLDIHPLQYLRLGLIVAPVLLVLGVLTLYVCGRLWG